jgi:MoaA/NifB/PqqE/SkfB family radical SAM enzyme
MHTKPYCKAPWVALQYTALEGCKPCCEWKGDFYKGNVKDYYASDYLKEFKSYMHADTMHDNCKECVDIEDRGGDSRRLKYMQYHIPHGLQKLDYRPGNKCNLKCIMCGPENSSMWEDAENITLDKLDTSDIHDLDFSKLHKVMILGGEPSIDLKVREFLKTIQDLDCYIGITVNATNASDKWFNTLKSLKTNKLEIALSIDGTGDVFEHQREGANWLMVKENIIKYKENFRNVIIQVTATNYNYPLIHEWWDELLSFDIDIWQSVCYMPDKYALKTIEDKVSIINWLMEWRKTAPENKYKYVDEAINMLRVA